VKAGKGKGRQEIITGTSSWLAGKLQDPKQGLASVATPAIPPTGPPKPDSRTLGPLGMSAKPATGHWGREETNKRGIQQSNMDMAADLIYEQEIYLWNCYAAYVIEMRIKPSGNYLPKAIMYSKN
jgi:hypothetical protein